jgi:hypothetical protein
MIQKNFKLKIKNKKTILLEAGPGAITQAMQKGAVEIAGAGADALKMTGMFLKRSWNSTFGYAWNIRKNIKKYGFPEGLEYANKEFLSKDKQVKREMSQLIKAQPGFKDANMFMAMTCPAAKAFDMFVDKVDIRGKGGGYSTFDDDRHGKEANEAKKAFYNIIMAVSHISHNTSIENIKINNRRLTTKELKKAKSKKYVLEDGVEKNIKDQKFINVCKSIQAFYKPEKNLEKFIKDSEVYKIMISLEQKVFLDLLIKQKSGREINAYLIKKEVYSDISRLAEIIIEKKAIEAIKVMFSFLKKQKGDKEEEGKEEENQDKLTADLNKKTVKDNFSIKIKSGNKILVEESQEEEGKEEESQEEENKPDLKEGMELSFSTYFVLRSLILSYISKINSQIPLIINIQTEGTLSSFINFDNINNFSSSIDEKSKSISADIEKVNKQISVFNNIFESDIGKIDNKILDDILEAKNKTIGEMKESSDELDSISDEKKKEIVKSKELLSILNDLASSSKEDAILYDKVKKHILDANSIIEEDLKENIPKFLETCKKYESLLNKYSISASTIESIKSNNEIANKSLEEIKNLENKIAEYTNKQSEIQSLIDEYQSEVDKEEEDKKDSESETIEIDADKLTDKDEEK